MRPLDAQNFIDKDPLTGGNPHSNNPGGNFDFNDLSVPPFDGEPQADRKRRYDMRQFLYGVLRKAGQENDLFAPPNPGKPGYKLFAMPLLCGDNPISNVVPSKFFRLTDTMLFLLKQWADGLFIDESKEDIIPPPLVAGAGAALDRGALAAALGGAFCPGAEAGWIMRNPAGKHRRSDRDDDATDLLVAGAPSRLFRVVAVVAHIGDQCRRSRDGHGMGIAAILSQNQRSKWK
jgi:hypothetical protein